MYRTCLCLIAVLGVASAASLSYSPRQQLRQAYYYNTPSPSFSSSSSSTASASTKAALRRIVLGHLQRLQLTERQQGLVYQTKPEMQLSPYRQPVYAAPARTAELFLPPNTPTPKNYAMNYLPEGRDVVPGTSYIPLRLLLIRR